ncbi:zinc-alpha-2-glycoprotein [Amia ocellicauda]|uniref:zinc-alpha-2-glycoprotein n=1 Tax=Amia ocellicauda TaxID=2972642 RepID=UPI003464E058
MHVRDTLAEMSSFLMLCLLSAVGMPVTKGTFTLRYLYTGSIGHPDQFVALVTLNGTQIMSYDSGSGKTVPQLDWLTEDLDVKFWSAENQRNMEQQLVFKRMSVAMLRSFNHTTVDGHKYTRVSECELDGSKVSQLSDRFCYDGGDFLILDRFADTWRAAIPQAQGTIQMLDASTVRVDLEQECMVFRETLTHLEGAPLAQQAPSSVTFTISVVLFTVMVCLGLIVISCVIAKKRGTNGPGYIAGPLGSLGVYYAGNQKTNPDIV